MIGQVNTKLSLVSNGIVAMKILLDNRTIVLYAVNHGP
jgi:hypothetical protein